ncbi:SCO family protein [Paucibacter sp. DJ2R-2]|uniref:SCO family protein n=1 Tax=Paucibacter sp. DJ2R-2 TaxID=2893558 RepID=UPI0021E41721|nr:SCO family protein [Paucibacter sp. DJ2R-2]MCV2438680.1 SCO family protein [Paucibacter sp. DJ2R-2]
MNRIGSTLAACALVLAGFFVVVGPMTAGFQFWTFESLRRDSAASGNLRFPVLELREASGTARRVPSTGHVGIVNFIYTRCESVCQSLGAEFFQAQQVIVAAGSSVRLLSMSIDPEYDTAGALMAYARRYNANPGFWTIAAPLSLQDATAARRQLGIVAIEDGFGGFTHNGTLHVVNRDGRVAAIFDTPDWQQALAFARRLDGELP